MGIPIILIILRNTENSNENNPNHYGNRPITMKWSDLQQKQAEAGPRAAWIEARSDRHSGGSASALDE